MESVTLSLILGLSILGGDTKVFRLVLGIMRQNFADNSSYSRVEAERILQRSGVREFAYQPFCQEFDLLTPTGRVLSRIVPATRLMYRIVA